MITTGSSKSGNIGARVATKLETGYSSDVIKLVKEGNNVIITRSIYGNKLHALFEIEDSASLPGNDLSQSLILITSIALASVFELPFR